MIFGNPEDIAIELISDPPPTPIASDLWGRVCVHADGVRLGDIERQVCLLSPIAIAFNTFRLHLGKLWDEDFEKLADDEVYDLLNSMLYLDWDVPDEVSFRRSQRFHKFDFLTGWGEPFDGFNAFVVMRSHGEFRILYRLVDDTRGVVAVTSVGMSEAIDGFLHWYQNEAEANGLGAEIGVYLRPAYGTSIRIVDSDDQDDEF